MLIVCFLRLLVDVRKSISFGFNGPLVRKRSVVAVKTRPSSPAGIVESGAMDTLALCPDYLYSSANQGFS